VDRPTVLSVARMYPRKRLEDLLEAAVILKARIPAVQVRIVGEGPESARLRARHRALGLGDAAAFLGEVPRSTMAVEYVGAHCFCLPTVQEGFGLVFAEAMAGLPSSRAGRRARARQDRRTGFLVNPEAPASWRWPWRFADNEGLRKDATGRRRVEARLVRAWRAFVEACRHASLTRRFAPAGHRYG
jgi:glycosyltransferase involved in cell wall biosynthesis